MCVCVCVYDVDVIIVDVLYVQDHLVDPNRVYVCLNTV